MIFPSCRALRRAGLTLFSVLVVTRTANAQQAATPLPATRHEVIRGEVTDPAGKPIPGAVVTSTRAPDRLFKQASTDSSGRYVIDWPDGTGDYLVHVGFVGFNNFRKRVTAAGPADTIFVVDAKLTSTQVAQQLAPVVSRASAARARPTRDAPPLGDPGSTDQTTSGMNGAVPANLAGDLAAIAATMPGVLPTAQGPSVMGLPSNQNSTTLNGMAFAGADVPRDAATRVRVSGSQYDPARGWFSGANTNVDLGPGNIFSSRRSRVTLDAPTLQYSDPVSARLGQRYTNALASVGGDGELIADKWYYNYGLQGGRRSSDPASLFTAGDDVLRASGISPDSIDRVRALMLARNIPFTGSSAGAAITDNISSLVRLDHKPYDAISLGAAKSTWGLTGYGRLSRAERLNTAPWATLGHEGESAQSIAMGQADWSKYFGPDYLAFFRSGLTYSRNRSTPYLAIPDARVLLQSDAGAAPLSVGGASSFGNDLRNTTWETTADVQFYAAGSPRHRVKLNADLRRDGYDQDIAGNQLGTFGYNSLAELDNNTPSSFTRTLNAPRRSGGEWNAFLAASDLWRISPTWQLMYGARVEGNRFTDAPQFNPQLLTTFGVRNDVAPQSLHVSPRLGFTWNRTGQVRDANIVNGVGNFRFGAPGVLRGGVGEFRSMTPAPLLSLASVATGLPSGLQRVSCVGSAVPIPNWSSFTNDESSIPAACADGSTGTAFNDVAPTAQMVDRDFSPPRSWRGNLFWGSAWKAINYTVEGAYSLNLNQGGTEDLNFSGTQRFTLAGENRPMFVQSSDIVSASGLVASSGSRQSTQFGRVTLNRGDGKSISRQLTVTARPSLFSRGFGRNSYFLAGYTLSSIRELQRGFDATTFADPRERSWARGELDARHQLVMQMGNAWGRYTATLTGRAQSGLPFTPMVSGDVNGDGFANDRAFLFNPATVTDPVLKSGLQSLIESSSSSVRECLTAHPDRAAGAMSCEGPWTATLNGQLSIAGGGRFLSRRATLNFGFLNIPGGVDQLLHGSSNLHGWGTSPRPDPVLFTVNGFDQTKGFSYTVNPRFGNTRPTSNTARAPFQLSVDVSIDLGKPLEAQQVARWLAPGRTKPGQLATSGELKRRFERNIPDLYREILRQSDSLLLSREQVEALTRAQAEHRKVLDGIWTELSDRLAALPKDFDAKDAARRLDAAIDQAWSATRDHMQGSLKAILNPVQMQLLPGPVKGVIESTGPIRMRIFLTG